MTSLPHEIDPCPLDGTSRDHIRIDGNVVSVCPFCHQQELVE